MSYLNARYSKWLGYEFASNFNPEDFPEINFPKGFVVGTFSGYLKDIIARHDGKPIFYVLDLRYKNMNYENEEQVIRITLRQFKEYFYNVTALPN